MYPKGNFIVADSSFYICFLEDINRSDFLLFLLDRYDFAVGNKIHMEISRCEHYGIIKGNPHLAILPDYNFSEALRPFFSDYENVKGEGEAIALAVILYGLRRIDRLILDEDGPRSFVENNLPLLRPLMIGTVGFVGRCYYELRILTKDGSLGILTEIEHSPFRVTPKVLRDVRSLIH